MIDWFKQYPSWVKTEIDDSELFLLSEILDHSVEKYPEHKALTCLGHSITYQELDEKIDRFAAFLQYDAKLKAGDRFAIMLPNIMQFIIAFYAAQRIGLVCVNTNPLYTPPEMEHQFCDSEVSAVIILDLFLPKLEKIISRTKITTVIKTSIADMLPWWKQILVLLLMRLKERTPKVSIRTANYRRIMKRKEYPRPMRPKLTLDDVALIQYTGGTTGVSKGAMLTHRNLMSNCLQISEWIGPDVIHGGESAITALPLYHIYSLTTNGIFFVFAGANLLLIPRPIPIRNTVEIFRKYKPTCFVVVNTLLQALNNDETFQKLKNKSVKIVFSGGMSLQVKVAEDWYKHTGTKVMEGYGLTEASPVALAKKQGQYEPFGSIGVPVPSTQAKIVDEEGNEVPTGSAGELIIKGPQIMKGYWMRDEETKAAVVDGWLHTGDVAKQDEDGLFFIVDRKKDLIIVSGFNVYPNEVEAVIAKHPKVLEVAVVGVKDPASVEAPKAFVVKKDDSLDEDELREFCKEYLTNYKRPKHYEFRDSLPKNNIGKILRKELRD